MAKLIFASVLMTPDPGLITTAVHHLQHTQLGGRGARTGKSDFSGLRNKGLGLAIIGLSIP